MVKIPKRTQAYLFLLINVIFWGAALPIVKVGLEFTTPFRYLTYRYILAILFSLPILWHYFPHIKNIWKSIKIITLLELIGTTLSLGFLYVGLNRTSAIEAGLIATTTPIFITLFGIWWLHEKEERHEWVGLAIAFVGTLLLTFLPPLLDGKSMFGGTFSGNFLVFLQNIATAVYFILAKRWYKNIPKLFVTAISFYVGFITFALCSLIEVGGSANTLLSAVRVDLTHPSVWLVAFYMATFGSILALSAYIKGQDMIEASEASLFSYLQPLIYIPMSFLLLRESVSWIQLSALGVILFGVFVAEKRFTFRRSSRSRNRKF
jgi:drug/metabolite transporter (DMT)-like permease